MVEGVGGITTPTRWSVWFQVSGIEDDAEKIGVEACVLKKVTKGSTSASYPTCPQMGPHIRSRVSWSWIQDTGTHRFHCWGLRSSPVFSVTTGGLDPEARHPQLILASDGCCSVKIQDCDVVDVANLTLEQDELKYMTGSGWSYVAVVTADKKYNLNRPRRRNGRAAKQPPLDSRLEFIHDRCRNPRQGFDKTGPCNVRGIENLRRRNTWETKGFRPAVCWRYIAIN